MAFQHLVDAILDDQPRPARYPRRLLDAQSLEEWRGVLEVFHFRGTADVRDRGKQRGFDRRPEQNVGRQPLGFLSADTLEVRPGKPLAAAAGDEIVPFLLQPIAALLSFYQHGSEPVSENLVQSLENPGHRRALGMAVMGPQHREAPSTVAEEPLQCPRAGVGEVRAGRVRALEPFQYIRLEFRVRQRVIERFERGRDFRAARLAE